MADRTALPTTLCHQVALFPLLEAGTSRKGSLVNSRDESASKNIGGMGLRGESRARPRVDHSGRRELQTFCTQSAQCTRGTTHTQCHGKGWRWAPGAHGRGGQARSHTQGRSCSSGPRSRSATLAACARVGVNQHASKMVSGLYLSSGIILVVTVRPELGREVKLGALSSCSALLLQL